VAKAQLTGELRQRAPGGDEGVLGEVAPQVVVADEPGDIPADARVIRLEESSERVVIALPRPLDERLFRGITAHLLRQRRHGIVGCVGRLVNHAQYPILSSDSSTLIRAPARATPQVTRETTQTLR